MSGFVCYQLENQFCAVFKDTVLMPWASGKKANAIFVGSVKSRVVSRPVCLKLAFYTFSPILLYKSIAHLICILYMLGMITNSLRLFIYV